MAVRGVISYWWLPIFPACVWLGMLLGMLLWWFVTIDMDRSQVPSLDRDMYLPYISDIGAFTLKPLFIAGSVVTTVTFDLSFAAERWLRHKGRLVPNTTVLEKVLVVLTILFAVVGTVGLICLSIFDTYRHPKLHDIFLLLFIGGYLISAIFICWEYQRLGIQHREHRVLRASFWVKLTFIFLEIGLAVAFGVLTFTDRKNIAAYFEWIISLIFTFYVLSFVIDLWPARRTKHHDMRFQKPRSPREMEESEASFSGGAHGRHTNGHF